MDEYMILTQFQCGSRYSINQVRDFAKIVQKIDVKSHFNDHETLIIKNKTIIFLFYYIKDYFDLVKVTERFKVEKNDLCISLCHAGIEHDYQFKQGDIGSFVKNERGAYIINFSGYLAKLERKEFLLIDKFKQLKPESIELIR